MRIFKRVREPRTRCGVERHLEGKESPREKTVKVFFRGYLLLLARIEVVHGSTDTNGMAPASDPVGPDDVCSTIFHRLGLNPHQELNTPTGRPIQLFREGKVVDRLLA